MLENTKNSPFFNTYIDDFAQLGLRVQKLHPKSLRNHLFVLKIYFRYLVETGKRKDHPCQHLHLKDQINRQIRIEDLYSKETLNKLYENYQSKNPEHQNRNKIIISLLIYQALTVLEITQLEMTDIDLKSGTIKIKGNPKNKSRKLKLKPEQILLFHTYKTTNRSHEKTEYFIVNNKGEKLHPSSINRMINQGKSKNEKLLPIKIRQSVIAQLLKEKNDIRIVQEFAGHRRTASTEAYKQTGLEALKSSIEKLHPLG